MIRCLLVGGVCFFLAGNSEAAKTLKRNHPSNESQSASAPGLPDRDNDERMLQAAAASASHFAESPAAKKQNTQSTPPTMRTVGTMATRQSALFTPAPDRQGKRKSVLPVQLTPGGMHSMEQSTSLSGIRFREFPAAPPLGASMEEYDATKNSAPYGDPTLFVNICRETTGPYQLFADCHRVLLVLYNLIKNQGLFRSDYHESCDPRVHKILIKRGLEEKHDLLRIPEDLEKEHPGIFKAIFKQLPHTQIEKLKKQFELERLDETVVAQWLKDNSDPSRPVANLDHILPKAQFGSNEFLNAAYISGECNRNKTDHVITPLMHRFAETPESSPCPRINGKNLSRDFQQEANDIEQVGEALRDSDFQDL